MPHHPTRARLVAIIASAGAIGALAGYLRISDPDLAVLVTPAVATAWIVFTLYHGYLAIRTHRWRRRRSNEPGEPSPDVAPPTVFPGVDLIHGVQRTTTPSIADYQGTMYARGIVIAAIPPLAVLLAALQTTMAPADDLAAGLSIANTALLIALILLVWRARNPSQSWVQARTRTELLRREQFLCLAQVGPYQTQAPLAEFAAHRAQLLATSAEDTLEQLILMRTNDTPWADRLWTEPNPPLDRLEERARTYLHHRIRNQITWFTTSASHNRNAERHIATVIKFSILAAVTATTVQTGLQLAGTNAPAATEMLTLVLPPVCAFMLAIQQLYSHRRLATSYSHTLRELTEADAGLTNLLSTMDGFAPGRRFQVIVLHTEHCLASELQRWRMLTHRDEYDLSL